MDGFMNLSFDTLYNTWVYYMGGCLPHGWITWVLLRRSLGMSCALIDMTNAELDVVTIFCLGSLSQARSCEDMNTSLNKHKYEFVYVLVRTYRYMGTYTCTQCVRVYAIP